MANSSWLKIVIFEPGFTKHTKYNDKKNFNRNFSDVTGFFCRS